MADYDDSFNDLSDEELLKFFEDIIEIENDILIGKYICGDWINGDTGSGK
jgi:hypothetical protein